MQSYEKKERERTGGKTQTEISYEKTLALCIISYAAKPVNLEGHLLSFFSKQEINEIRIQYFP